MCLCNQRLNNIAFHISESIASALMLKDEPFMIYAKKMEEGRLKIMHMDRVFGNAVS